MIKLGPIDDAKSGRLLAEKDVLADRKLLLRAKVPEK